MYSTYKHFGGPSSYFHSVISPSVLVVPLNRYLCDVVTTFNLRGESKNSNSSRVKFLDNHMKNKIYS